MLSGTDIDYLRRCVELAREALEAGDAPFGSVLVNAAGEIIKEDRNRVTTEADVTLHPEFTIATWAQKNLTPRERAAATVYTSGEHCPMCAATHAYAGLGRIVYASSSAQLVQWRTELGIKSGPVVPLSINQVAPGLVVEGPAVGLDEQESSETIVASDASVSRNLAPLPGQHQTPLAREGEIPPTEATNGHLPLVGPLGSLIEGVAQDAALSLEYLALGRQYVNGNRTTANATGGPTTIDFVVPMEQARVLIAYHGDNLAWMHNILHMPTFREQCEYFFQNGKPIDRFWLPLYYTTLSMTIHLTRPDVLLGFGIDDPQPLAEHLHQKSIDTLFAVNFMAYHSIFSVQTICMLIHVGYNLGQSDLIASLMGSAIRIAQSLGLHRLGPDKLDSSGGTADSPRKTRKLIDREVKKRIWWFIIRQDWLQIPFMNTYTIHASQFNTPRPKHCVDDPKEMVKDGSIVELDLNSYSQGSPTSVMNLVAVLIWKTQDRMFNLGHPSNTSDGMVKLYEEVMFADSQLKKIMTEMPIFYKENGVVDGQLPAYIIHQKQVLLIFMAHKASSFFTLHRHFHILSFKNAWYSLSKLSCLSIARKSLNALNSLPNDEYTWTVRNMWTVNVQTVTETVLLLFEDLFTANDELRLIDSTEIQQLAHDCSSWFKEISDKSDIAKRGAKIIDFLVGLTSGVKTGRIERIDLDQIIAIVQSEDTDLTPAEVGTDQTPIPTEDTNWAPPGIDTWESIFTFIGCYPEYANGT
ncbi:C6 transcription factor [Talaromyces pinophilus]|uniref:C6 transcription factor n=1 Tax=Talaromyces pinophilus TaxID=128442 RepID=A0A6V8GYE9_TALPI|nr:C6 transcription factor [Talaromyces pinophilus]